MYTYVNNRLMCARHIENEYLHLSLERKILRMQVEFHFNNIKRMVSTN